MTEGFEYGNARVRARRADLFTRAQYESLLSADPDRLLARLSDSPYRPDLTAAAPRYAGMRAFDEALRMNLARNLRDVLSWYQGSAAAEVAPVVRRWDFRNIRTILRGHYARAEPDEIRAALVPAGDLAEEMLGELAGQPGLRQAVELMVAWGLPTPDAAHRVAAAMPTFESTGDLGGLEAAMDLAVADLEHGALAAAADPEVLRVLRAEIDERNLLAAIRLHVARRVGGDRGTEPTGSVFLAGGSVPGSSLDRIAAAADHTAATALVEEISLPEPFRPAVRRWSTSENLSALVDDLDEAVTRAAVGLFTTADPLGAGVPLAFVWAKENEVANLRTIGAAVEAGVPPDMIEQELVILP
jgi:V/A-type H+-transporting ATPase subunit C